MRPSHILHCATLRCVAFAPACGAPLGRPGDVWMGRGQRACSCPDQHCLCVRAWLLQVVRSARSVTAFVEFEDVSQAMAVHASLQGAILPSSSDRGGLRIQYSKAPFGRRPGAA